MRALVQEHADETHSRFAAMLLHDWEIEREKFWQVVPKEFARYLPVPMSEPEALTA